MTHATVVVAPSSLRAVAERWAADGLVGESVWLDSELARSTEGNAERQSLRPKRLIFGMPVHDVLLTEYLAHRGPVDAVHIVWVRTTDDDTHAAAMTEFLTFIRSLLPRGSQPDALDVLLPATLEPPSVPDPVPEWRQFLVAPEDRPEPGSVDAGWTHRSDSVHLHAVLQLAGVFAGQSQPPQTHGNSISVVHAFSRLVGGGSRVQRRVDAFLADGVTTRHAAQVRPEQFAEFEEPRVIIADAVEWLTTSFNGLTYTPDAPGTMAPAPTLTLSQHVRRVGHSLRLLIRGSQGTPESSPTAVTTWGGGDLPYRVGRSTIKAVPQRSWSESDRELRQVIESHLHDLPLDDASLPSPETWRALLSLNCSLVDGGPGPDGWTSPAYIGHPLVLEPRWVDPVALDPVDGDPDVSTLVENIRELRGEHSPMLVAAALERVNHGLKHAASPLDQPEPEVASRPAMHLVTRVLEADEEARRTQRSQLPDVTSATRPESLLDILRSRLLGDFLLARLDGRRWHELAVADYPELVDLEAARRRGRRALALIVAIATAFVPAWLAIGDDALARLQTVGVSIDPWVVPSIVSVLLAVGLLWTAVTFHRSHAAFHEWWRRLLELRCLLAGRAAEAYMSNRVLEHSNRLLFHWHGIVAHVFSGRHDANSGTSAVPSAELPLSCVRADPDYSDGWLLRTQVAPRICQPGWRMTMLRHILTTAVREEDLHTEGRKALDALCAADGLPGSALERVAHEVLTGRPWRAWVEATARASAADIRAKLGSGVRTLEPTEGNPTEAMSVGEFFAPLLNDRAHLAFPRLAFRNFGASPETLHYASPGVRATPGESTLTLSPNDAWCAVYSRLDVWTFLADPPRGETLADDDEER